MNPILNQQLQNYRSQIDEIVKELHHLTLAIQHRELSQTVSDLRNRITEPFMFVIVGEVKAGKSSFINALLDTEKEICKVAPSPMTDTIQQIVYGEEEAITEINPYLKRISQPVDILREIAIVDTPGTNTIVDHHQEITESFIPASDLIVFVFEAKNPYRQSAWDFFQYIHSDWRKKIIFVLQQKDLMNAADLAINVQGVEDYARKQGIEAPLVFAVSAKQELEAQKEISGFIPVREYIRQHITGGKAPILKLQNNLATSQNISERIHRGLDLRRRQYEADLGFRQDIHQTLDLQETNSQNLVKVLVENLVASYDRATLKTERELTEGLSFFSLIRRSFSSIFVKNESAKEWLKGLSEKLETELNEEMKSRLNQGVSDIADSIQQMAKIIDLKIKNSQTILANNHEIFSSIAERRANVLRELQETFANFLKRSDSFTDEELFPQRNSIAPNLAAGGGVAVVGALLTGLTNLTVLDVTGGILTALGLVFAGVSIGINRRKIIRGYRSEIDKGRQRLESEVSEKLRTYIRHIKQRIDSNFGEFDQLIEQEEQQIAELLERQENIRQQMLELGDQLGQLLTDEGQAPK
ncbi:MAG: dynamin family protein [Bacteroidota bacterium]